MSGRGDLRPGALERTASSREALTRTVLLPLLAETAEACGGFDWDDDCFERAYAGFEASLFGSQRSYGAIAPLVGISTGAVVDLGEAIRVRHVASGEVAGHWPQAGGLLPDGFEREPDRLCLLELQWDRPVGTRGGTGCSGEVADAVMPPACDGRRHRCRTGALRAARLAPVRIRPFFRSPPRNRPASPCAGAVRAARALRLRERLGLADDDRDLGEALDRWELSLFQEDRSLRSSFAAR